MSRWRGASSVTSVPPMLIAPAVTSSRPAIMRNSVDFPQPDGPTSTMNSWSLTARLMSSTARKPFSYTLVTPSISIEAISGLPSFVGAHFFETLRSCRERAACPLVLTTLPDHAYTGQHAKSDRRASEVRRAPHRGVECRLGRPRSPRHDRPRGADDLRGCGG